MALVDDTGFSSTDGITNDDTVRAVVDDAGPITLLQASLNGGPYVNVLSSLNSDVLILNEPHAADAGIDTCLATPPGGHDFAFWKQSFSDSLPWLSWKLKLTPQPHSVPATCTAGKS